MRQCHSCSQHTHYFLIASIYNISAAVKQIAKKKREKNTKSDHNSKIYSKDDL